MFLTIEVADCKAPKVNLKEEGRLIFAGEAGPANDRWGGEGVRGRGHNMERGQGTRFRRCANACWNFHLRCISRAQL